MRPPHWRTNIDGTAKALVFDQFDRPGASQLSLELSEADIQKVRAGDYKVCVSTYMETTPVSHSKLEGLRDGLNTLGIHLVQKTDAHGSYPGAAIAELCCGQAGCGYLHP